ncbi:hypothetical protein CDD80_4837 [Ophiocordyceps camponoti-rufipedis]|uniref:Uncharacterized protein n=1 Tax=Ophiocordyceps camponoti-rufipedis TaxID=2004952 RepID=A0A2C5XGX4_9HYPO|nr:hypothetical protein CDD80_4837 [Ophiocordyceps camponoti-rufipedis]
MVYHKQKREEEGCVKPQLAKAKSKAGKQSRHSSTPRTSKEVIRQRRSKANKPGPAKAVEHRQTTQHNVDAPTTFRVNASTASVFATLFDRSESRGAVRWAAFEAAMADLGFTVMPQFGSIYRFEPPGNRGFSNAFSVHRPHRSRMENYKIHPLARQLRDLYGWSAKTFEVV